MEAVAIFFLLLILPAPIFMQNDAETLEEEKYGVKYASDCEVCKVVAIEFQVGKGMEGWAEIKIKMTEGQTVRVREESRCG